MKRRLESWLERRKLRLNEKKTRIVDFNRESFEFLGFRLAWRKARSGKSYPHCEPSAKSCNKLREAIREQTSHDTLWKSPKEVFAAVNRRLRGWIGYFHFANSTRVFDQMQWSTRERLRRWLWKKHAKRQARYGPTYSDESLHDHYGLIRFPMHGKWQTL
jgi:RNA-directed DNA polymerase